MNSIILPALPEYDCRYEDFAFIGFGDSDHYFPHVPQNSVKLVHEGPKNGTSNRKKIGRFLRGAIGTWRRNNIGQVQGKSRFGCQFSDENDKYRVVCIFD
ncbi:hypothetical protein ANCCAN_10991 [Ancylostoma caninum]|uniref:SCP domain-containing protein n=1 Tax=Ancylostoma caninum TaxID=29170 RepID=A0A368GF85_ANCCA|nr:hypothetical protein ANCCAN_10991 [Ancylostoma caninum]